MFILSTSNNTGIDAERYHDAEALSVLNIGPQRSPKIVMGSASEEWLRRFETPLKIEAAVVSVDL